MRTRKSKKTQPWYAPYLKMTKAQLIAILDPEMGIEQTLTLGKKTKRALAYQIRKKIRQEVQEQDAARKRLCPKGHKYDDPACSLSCHVVEINPHQTPFITDAPRVPASSVTHSWVSDTLKPIDDPPPPPAVAQRRTELLLSGIDAKYLDPLAKMYEELNRQFDVPKRKPWWRRWLDVIHGWADYNWELIKFQWDWFSYYVSVDQRPRPRKRIMVDSIDIYGPGENPFCPEGRCIDQINCTEQGGCCFPPIKVKEPE